METMEIVFEGTEEEKEEKTINCLRKMAELIEQHHCATCRYYRPYTLSKNSERNYCNKTRKMVTSNCDLYEVKTLDKIL